MMHTDLLAAIYEWYLREERGFDSGSCRKLAELAQDYSNPDDKSVAALNRAIGRCESPMERRFLLGMVGFNQSPCSIGDDADGGVLTVVSKASGASFKLSMQTQATPEARVDFTMSSATSLIEIDGHEFHERTKHQAAHDKSRDRQLAAAGYRVLRFTGSEVNAEPNKCAAEAIAVLDGAGGGT